MLTIKAVEEQKAENQAKIKEIWDSVERREVKNLTEEETKQIDELENLVKGAIDTIEKLKSSQEIVEEEVENKKEQPMENVVKKEIIVKEKKQFENFLREVKNASEENLTVDTNGAVIPSSIANKIITKVIDISPIFQMSDIYNVTGNLTIPIYDEETQTITCDYADEFTDAESSSGKFTSVELKGYLLRALTKVSKSLINNSAFDIVDFVVTRMAEAISRKIEKELLMGTTNKIEGLKKGITQVVEAGSATAITADNLIDVQEEVPDTYQENSIWIMKRSTRKAIRKLKDSEGNYLLNRDLTAKWGYTLLGKDVYCSDNMEEIGAGNDPVFYGDMKGLATKVSEQMSIQVLREKYAEQHVEAVLGFVELDSKIQNKQMLSKLTMVSS